jgi:molecular chaperone DnaK
MTDDPKSWDKPRKFDRKSVNLLVQYRFDSFEDFLAEYSVNLSPGGMFIRSDEPRALGSMIYLQFFIKDGSKIIEGLGKVVRVSTQQDKEGAGMGIEFVNFDDESMRLIREICQSRTNAGRPSR